MSGAQRRYELDLAKALAIVAMIITHTGEEFSFEPYVGRPWFHLVAAPLFMFSMGVTMRYTSHNTAEDFARRGVHLIFLGYVLNFFRSTIWLIFGKLFWDREPWGILESFATLDILHFAGLAFLTVALLRKLRCPEYGMLLISLVMLAFAPMLDTHMEDMRIANYFQGFLWRAHGEACFPLMNWFVFPCLGISFGKLLKWHVREYDRFYSILLPSAAVMLLAAIFVLRGCGIDVFSYVFAIDKYYSMNLASVSMHLLAILTIVALCFFAMKAIDGGFRDAIVYISRNLNNIYITQWLLIESFYTIWLIATMHSFRVPVALAVPVGLAVSAASVLIYRAIDLYLLKRYKGE